MKTEVATPAAPQRGGGGGGFLSHGRQNNDKTLLLEMDVKGSMSVKKLYPQHTFSIFILPPSLDHLRKRLKNRGTDSDDRIEIRLKRFQQEIEFQNKFDQVMINENLELAKVELINIVNKLKQGVINGT